MRPPASTYSLGTLRGERTPRICGIQLFTMTIAIDALAPLAAKVAAGLAATITSTLRRHRTKTVDWDLSQPLITGPPTWAMKNTESSSASASCTSPGPVVK
jgi:hypothetical protein